MTQVSPAPSPTGPAAIRVIPSGNGAQAGFSLALGGLQRPGPARVPAPAPESDPETKARQAVAGTGKDLPGEKQAADTDTDTEQTEVEAAFAWFGVALPPPPEAAPAIVAFGQPVTAVTAPEGQAAPLPQAVLPEGLTDPAPVAVETVATGEAPAFDLAAPSPEPAAPAIDGIDIARPVRAEGPVRIELPAKIELPAGSPILQTPHLQTIAALQPRPEGVSALATLAAQAGITLPEQFRRPAARETTIISTLTPTSAIEVLRPNVVQAVADAQQAAIDTRRSEWMSQTIDRIEALRDSPNSRETSIRLSPDALGKVDVSIRQEGDRIHVRFVAENAQARTLLTEAQSRLTEIAEARGLKLGGTSVDAGPNAGNAGQGQRHDAAPSTTSFSTAPVSVTGGETATDSDARVA